MSDALERPSLFESRSSSASRSSSMRIWRRFIVLSIHHIRDVYVTRYVKELTDLRSAPARLRRRHPLTRARTPPHPQGRTVDRAAPLLTAPVHRPVAARTRSPRSPDSRAAQCP